MKPILSVALSLASLSLSLGACSEDIDPADVASVPIDDYETWDVVEPLLGPVPGHGDTYRVMYRNEEARRYTGAGEYPLGAAIVKEIYSWRPPEDEAGAG